MKRKFLSAVLSVTLAACLFGNTVFASELGIGSTDVPEVTVETEESSEASEEIAETSEASEESREETGEASEEAVESSEVPGEEINAASGESSAADESNVESEMQTVEAEIGESAGLTYTVDGDTVTITGEGECWTNGSELQTAISNAKHVVFKECKIQGSMKRAFAGYSTLQSINLSGLDTSEVTDMYGMFWGCSGLTSLEIGGINTSQVTNMELMFAGCSGLTSLDVSGFDTSQVTNMASMFLGCSGLTSINVSNFDTSNVTSMVDMFRTCNVLASLDVSGFDTSKVTDMSGMFFGGYGLTSLDVSNFDTSNVTKIRGMFQYCTRMKTLDLSSFDLSKVLVEEFQAMLTRCLPQKIQTPKALPAGCSISLDRTYQNPDGVKTEALTPEFAGTTLTAVELTYTVEGDTVTITGEGTCWTVGSGMQIAISNAKHVVFRDCKIQGSMFNAFAECSNLQSIDLSGLDTSQVTSMGGMFYNCSGLTNLDVSNFNTSRVADMACMFYGCSGLTSLDLSSFSTSSVADMKLMFRNCSSLISLNLSSFNTSRVTHMGYMFCGCYNLTSLDISGFNTSKVTNMDCMFCLCLKLTSLDVSNFDTSQVTSMRFMFSSCSSLKNLDVSGFDTSKVVDMRNMFESCSGLKTLDLSSFDLSKVSVGDEGLQKMLTGCSLEELRTPKALPAGCSIALGRDYQTTAGITTAVLTPEFVSTTLKLVQVKPAPAKFTVAGVVGGRNVTFKSDTQGAVIYYSTKTSNITTNDTCVKNGETVLFENFYGTVYARPYLNGVWGNVSKLILKIPVVNTPVITVKGSEVSIKTTTGACTIYYTTDGSTPSPTNGKKLTKSAGSFTVTGSCTVKAIAVRSCFTNSAIASAQVKVSDTRPSAPSFGVKGVIGGREVTFNSKDSKAEIYYSFTTSNITTKDKHVKAGEKVLFENHYGTIYARAYLNGKWSNVSRLVLKIPTVNAPSIKSAGNGKVKITTTTPNCIIYYTTDGSTPSPTNGRRVNSSSTVISVGAGKTVKAIAVRSCFTNSKVVTYKK